MGILDRNLPFLVIRHFTVIDYSNDDGYDRIPNTFTEDSVQIGDIIIDGVIHHTAPTKTEIIDNKAITKTN